VVKVTFPVVGKDAQGRDIVEARLKSGETVRGVVIHRNEPFGALFYVPETDKNRFVRYEEVVETITEPLQPSGGSFIAETNDLGEDTP